MSSDTLCRPAGSERSPLALDKPGLYATIFLSLLVVETFSGALRYYFDQAGVAALLYLPKLACLAAVGLELLTQRNTRGFWVALLVGLTSSLLALLHGAVPLNIAFALFGLTPLLFAVVCGRYLADRGGLLALVIGLCLAASLAGLALDMTIKLPWKGYSYVMGETELSGNRSWGSGDMDRPAGFARMSTTLSVMLAVYSLFLASWIHSRLARLALYALAFGGIWLSTNKSTLAAYAATLLMMTLIAYRLPSATAFLLAVVGGAALPIASLSMNVDPNTVAGASDHALASFNDRLANSWPNFIGLLRNEGWLWSGAGFGAVGSSGSAFPILGLDLLIVADNTALYLWGMFGALGLLLYGLWNLLLLRLHDQPTPLNLGLCNIAFCLCLIGWATDVLEVPVAGLFLGLAIALAMQPRAPAREPLPATTHPHS